MENLVHAVKTGNPDAVLTTTAGEYGLPLDFDATTIIPATARFGPAAVVWAETGGASPRHDRGHLEDAFEMDEVTKDGDLDMVMQFPMQDTGFSGAETEGCVKGSFEDPGGGIFKFFGCDVVRIIG